jgi:hypothetical protein
MKPSEQAAQSELSMYAYYTYKPKIDGIVGKMPSLEELLMQEFKDRQEVVAYINSHRIMAHLFKQQASTMRPILEGETAALPSPREFVEHHLHGNRSHDDVFKFANAYFAAINHCMRSSPKLMPFGKPPTEAQQRDFFDRMPLPRLDRLAYELPNLQELLSRVLNGLLPEHQDLQAAINTYIIGHQQALMKSPQAEPLSVRPEGHSDSLSKLSPVEMAVKFLELVVNKDRDVRAADLFGGQWIEDSHRAPHAVLIRREGEPEAVFVVAGFNAATALASRYENASVVPVSHA